jgi:lipopolysaccharide biosynthesis glycosyltransferase
MHIVTASDENYVPGVLALISSAAKHNPETRFSVLQSGWSSTSQTRLKMLKERLGIEVSCIGIGTETFDKFTILGNYLTPMTFARLLIPELFPDDDRVMYIDSDMLIVGSLREAWECDLTDKYLAAVHDMLPSPTEMKSIKLDPAQYFNAGFLMINLEAWRSHTVAQSCIDALSAPDCPYLLQDQSALNDIARGKVLYLDAGYNFYAVNGWDGKITTPRNSIRVIHYLGSEKPWNVSCSLSEIWLDEATLCPELSYIPKKKVTIRRRLSILNQRRIRLMKTIAGIHDHRAAHVKASEVMVRDYLKTGTLANGP